jgi:hypothetical protein
LHPLFFVLRRFTRISAMVRKSISLKRLFQNKQLKKTERFVILTMVRSGSYMLASALNSHPEIVCYGELVKKNPLSEIDYLDFRDKYPDADLYIERRLEKPVDFIERVLSFSGEQTGCCGFKLMIPQNPEALEYVCSPDRFRKIVLYRENILASYASNLVARSTLQGVAFKGDEVRKEKVVFDPKGFGSFMKRRLRTFRTIRERLKNQSFFEIEYLVASTARGIGKTLLFLGFEPSDACTPGTIKRHHGPIVDRFENKKTVAKHMKEIGREGWLYEG